MKIKPSQRVFLAGKTGSGKTYFAKHLLAGLDRLVVIDPKGKLNDWNLKNPSPLDWSKFARGSSGRFRIYPPIVDDIADWYENLFHQLYDIGDLTVYIDELYAVVPPGNRAGKWLSAMYTRGRESGIGVWAAAQRPSLIPLFAISESDWIIAFRLNMEEDRYRLSKIAGDQLQQPINDKHGFWLYNDEYDKPYYYRSIVVQGVDNARN